MKVKKFDAGKTLLAFLRGELTTYPSVKAIKRAIEAKQCILNGRVEAFSTHPVQEGDEVTIDLAIQKSSFTLDILYEDETLIVYNKPPGRAVETLSDSFLVHRLDKETSGAIVFAKTKKKQDVLIDLFRKRKVQKSYLVICDGKVKQNEWVADNFLEKKATYQGGSLYGRAPKGKGKRAITEFRVLKKTETATLLLAKPITGRTHQVRVHLKEIGHPILGDFQYGKQFICSLKPLRHMLHSHELAFEQICCTAPILDDFFEVQKILFDA